MCFMNDFVETEIKNMKEYLNKISVSVCVYAQCHNRTGLYGGFTIQCAVVQIVLHTAHCLGVDAWRVNSFLHQPALHTL